MGTYEVKTESKRSICIPKRTGILVGVYACSLKQEKLVERPGAVDAGSTHGWVTPKTLKEEVLTSSPERLAFPYKYIGRGGASYLPSVSRLSEAALPKRDV